MLTLHFTQYPSGGIERLHAANVTHAYPPHLHECDSIGILLHGEERIICSDRMHVVRAGEAFVVAAEELHAGESLDAEYILLKVAADRALRTGVIEDGVLTSMLFELLAGFEESSAGALSRLVDALPARGQNDPTSMADVRDYMKSHSTAGVSLGELTRVAHFSRFHLVRRFRRAIGVTPHEYQTQLRVAHARRLLRIGRSIADTAVGVGFVDQSHLSRHFKRIVGITPGDYVAGSNFVQDALNAAR
jgi:AraC-like DNA-binding protein